MPNAMAALPNIAPSVQRRKVSLTPSTRVPCSNAARTRNPLKLAGVPQTNETISAASRPKFTIFQIHVREILLLNKFFPFVDMCLNCEDMARQSCAMVPRWRFYWVLHFQRAACSTFQTCILNSHQGHTMCRLTPTTRVPCSNAAKTRSPLKLAGVPQTNETISAANGPNFTILWGHVEEILLFNNLFRLSICVLVAKIQPDKVVRWCADGDCLRFFGSCLSSEPRAAGVRPAF